MDYPSTHTTPAEEPEARREPRQPADDLKLKESLAATIRDWQTHGRFDRLAEAHRIRSCWHSQRTGTGTYGAPPHGSPKQIFPWEGAPDTDSMLVDQIVREDVDIHMLAWWMGQRSVRPRDVMNDEAHRKSEAWRHLLDFELDQTERARADQLELFWNCLAEVNCCVWHEGWMSQWRRGRKTMSFQAVLAAVLEDAVIAAEDQGITFSADHEDQAIGAMLLGLHDTALAGEMLAWIKRVDPLCPDDEARQLLRAWRKGEQVDTPYYAPVPMPGCALPRALIPGVHCIWPTLTEHGQQVPIDVLTWHTGAEILQLAQREKWDKEWTADLLENHKGMVVDWTTLGLGTTYDGLALNGLDFGNAIDIQALRNADLYQIATRYDWGVGRDGLPSPYRTVYHGMVDGYAIRECDPCGTGRLPLMIVNREVRSSYTADFRGICHQLNSHQVAEKQLTDGLHCQALLRAGPPVKDTMSSSADGLQPFMRVSGDARAAARYGGDFAFMQVPDLSPAVIQWAELGRRKVDQIFMRGPDADPDARRARRMRQIHRACMFYREMQLLLCCNAREDVRGTGTLTLGSVNGVPVNAIISIADLEGELDMQHKCDVAAFDLELAMKKIEMLSKVLGFDRYGTTDFNKLYRILVGWVDADIAGAAITTFEQATDRERTEVDGIIAKVAAGVIVTDDELTKNAGNPELREARIRQWQSLPDNQRMMAERPLVAEQLGKLLAHYGFQMEQFQQNAVIGRTMGVAPELKSLGGGDPLAPSPAPEAGGSMAPKLVAGGMPAEG